MKLFIKNLKKQRKEIIETGFPYFGISAESFLNEYIEKGENESGYSYFGCIFRNELAGYLLLSVVEDEAEIVQIAVRENCQRKGFSTMLINEAFNYCEQVCVKSIFLEVRKSNAAALFLYEKNGFVQIGTRKDYYDNPTEDAIVMKRVF